MRGKPPRIALIGQLFRITPADAGKTVRAALGNAANAGSPPRMRGKLNLAPEGTVNLRITPADAGKTGRGCAEFRQSVDHPRGCGENTHFRGLEGSWLGSPPRMRGKLEGVVLIGQNLRITPADAGKTFRAVVTSVAGWDHPRGCGENRTRNRVRFFFPGSPPRMRGKPDEVTAYQAEARITPADAGKTAVLVNSCGREKDHPRGCGENAYRLL